MGGTEIGGLFRKASHVNNKQDTHKVWGKKAAKSKNVKSTATISCERHSSFGIMRHIDDE